MGGWRDVPGLRELVRSGLVWACTWSLLVAGAVLIGNERDWAYVLFAGRCLLALFAVSLAWVVLLRLLAPARLVSPLPTSVIKAVQERCKARSACGDRRQADGVTSGGDGIQG
jgi:hypothetical protein